MGYNDRTWLRIFQPLFKQGIVRSDLIKQGYSKELVDKAWECFLSDSAKNESTINTNKKTIRGKTI